MKLENIDINKTLEKARELLKEENISLAFKAVIEVMLLIITLLVNRFNLNSKNSSKPPSDDPNRKKEKKKNLLGKKPGGQYGHIGKKLQLIDNPDEIIVIPVNKDILPKGDYIEIGYNARQVINIKISKYVIEYRAQILISNGIKFIAQFPDQVTRPIQYGTEFKAHSVYLSQFQLVPYNRIKDYFSEEIKIPISMGSIYNFNKEAYDLLGGSIAMNDIGILPFFKGILCHDHWKPYFIYQCSHSLCNAHHLRELQRSFEQDNQQWALSMKTLLLEINNAIKETNGLLKENDINKYCEKYDLIIIEAKRECLLPESNKRIKKTKSQNLLERLYLFKKDILRFMQEVDAPFTNNLAENNIRMTKVQQKISGCFRSIDGAYIFCRIRSYLSTCRKNNINVTDALRLLFQGEMPAFITDDIKNE